MRLFQWCDQGMNLPTLTFDHDEPDGGAWLICGFCNGEFNEKGLDVCPHCGKDLVFPRCDW